MELVNHTVNRELKNNDINNDSKDIIKDKSVYENGEPENIIEEFYIEEKSLDCPEHGLMQVENSLKQDNIKEENENMNKYKNVKVDNEERHSRLINLLTKSKFYAQFVLDRVNEQHTLQKEKGDKENKKSKANRKRKNENSNTPMSKKKKLNDSSSQSASIIPDSENSLEINPGFGDFNYVPKLFKNGTMRPYQLEGFQWLKVMFENGVNGILADEMGLGKTIQSIALMCHLLEMEVSGPFLVVAPLSTLSNWMSEFNRFAPQISIIIYHGSESERKDKRNQLLETTEIFGRDVFPVIVTSYEVIIRDKKHLNRIPWSYIIIDEGHRLKNHSCRLTQTLHTFSSGNRLILTGTPLQNNLAELWSLLNFILPEIFDSLDVFESWFNITEMMDENTNAKIVQQEREKQVVSILHQILQPFLLRRIKTDVDLQLPKKKEILVNAPMAQHQVEMYKATLKKDLSLLKNEKKEAAVEYGESGRPIRKTKNGMNLSVLFNDSRSENALNKYLEAAVRYDISAETKIQTPKTHEKNITMQNICMQLRKIVNHPYLVSYPLQSDGEYKIDEDILKHCGKMQVLDQILGKLQKDGHKVLLFSQMTKMLNIIEDYLSLRPQFEYRRLDGKVSLEDRSQYIKEFNEDKNVFLFLLSTRAGGLGINLTSADTVIIYDSDWNPQQDLQAQDRCHRIGQTKPVLVMRFCTENTIDQKIIERASTKRKLEKIILKSGKFKSKVPVKDNELVINPEELLSLLEKSDHSKTCNKSSESVLSEKELEDILDRSDLR